MDSLQWALMVKGLKWHCLEQCLHALETCRPRSLVACPLSSGVVN